MLWILLCLCYAGHMASGYFYSEYTNNFPHSKHVDTFSCNADFELVVRTDQSGIVHSPCHGSGKYPSGLTRGQKILVVTPKDPATSVALWGFQLWIRDFQLAKSDEVRVGSRAETRGDAAGTILSYWILSSTPNSRSVFETWPRTGTTIKRHIGYSIGAHFKKSPLFVELYTAPGDHPHTGRGFVFKYEMFLNRCLLPGVPYCKNGARCHRGDYTREELCLCTSGFKGKTCATDIDECTSTGSCEETATCTNLPGTFRCVCKDGYGKDEVNTCSDIDECTDGTHNCDTNADCDNIMGSFTCSCKVGFTGDGVSCTDIDECSSTDSCGETGTCSNFPGTFSCTCNEGYEKDDNKCSDIDECSLIDSCGENESCSNLPGTFSCTCNDGYERGLDGKCSKSFSCSRNTQLILWTTETGTVKSPCYNISDYPTELDAGDKMAKISYDSPYVHGYRLKFTDFQIAATDRLYVGRATKLLEMQTIAVRHYTFTSTSATDRKIYVQEVDDGPIAKTLTLDADNTYDIEYSPSLFIDFYSADNTVSGRGFVIDYAADINKCLFTGNDVYCKNGGVCTRTGFNAVSCNCAGTGYEGTTCTAEQFSCSEDTQLIFRTTVIGAVKSPCYGVSSYPDQLDAGDKMAKISYDTPYVHGYRLTFTDFQIATTDRLYVGRATRLFEMQTIAVRHYTFTSTSATDSKIYIQEVDDGPIVKTLTLDADNTFDIEGSSSLYIDFYSADNTVSGRGFVIDYAADLNKCLFTGNDVYCKNGGVCTRTGFNAASCECAGTGYEGPTCATESFSCDGYNVQLIFWSTETGTARSPCYGVSDYPDEVDAGDKMTKILYDSPYVHGYRLTFEDFQIATTDRLYVGRATKQDGMRTITVREYTFTSTSATDGKIYVQEVDDGPIVKTLTLDTDNTYDIGNTQTLFIDFYSVDKTVSGRGFVINYAADINKCLFTGDYVYCKNAAVCTRTGFNAVSCDCAGTGYEGTTCTADTDECTIGTHNCDANADCNNNMGNFTCSCKVGFTGDGLSCTDIDECSPTDPCEETGTCSNLPGKFSCICNDGYENGMDGKCSKSFSCNDDSDLILRTTKTGMVKSPCYNISSYPRELDAGDKMTNISYDSPYVHGYRLTFTDFQIATSDRVYVGKTTKLFEMQTIAVRHYTFTSTSATDGKIYVQEIEDGPIARTLRLDTNNTYDIENTPMLFIDLYTTADTVGGRGFVIDYATDIDKCLFMENDIYCKNGGVCTRTGFNTASCSCAGTGYEGTTCETDLDECTLGTHDCDPVNTICINTDGSFLCKCKASFTADGDACIETTTPETIIPTVTTKKSSELNSSLQSAQNASGLSVSVITAIGIGCFFVCEVVAFLFIAVILGYTLEKTNAVIYIGSSLLTNSGIIITAFGIEPEDFDVMEITGLVLGGLGATGMVVGLTWQVLKAKRLVCGQ